MSIKATVHYNDELIEPNSQRQYELFSQLMWEVDKRLQDEIGKIIPGPFHDDFNVIRNDIAGLAAAAGKIAEDITRFDGDMDKALDEARWRGDIS